MKTRLLKHTRNNLKSLRSNAAHGFAASHALKIFTSHSIYTYIPKNACSTLRTSIAIANQCIKDASEVDWIHQNNETFLASTQDLILADYTFVILRDPFARLASTYLDKIVSKREPAWLLYDTQKRQIDLEELTFAGFVRCLSQGTTLLADHHWRPQADFLVYERYDDYFAQENFKDAAAVMEQKAGLPIVDARSLTGHGIDQYTLMAKDVDASGLSAHDIRQLQRDGRCPHPVSLYTPEIVQTVARLYAADVQLYVEKTGLGLLFAP